MMSLQNNMDPENFIYKLPNTDPSTSEETIGIGSSRGIVAGEPPVSSGTDEHINNLILTQLRTLYSRIVVASGQIQSQNFVQGVTGWQLTAEGILYATGVVISGTITATSGTIGGWTINSTTITGGNTTLDSTGVITLGTSNDVVKLSSVDATYRIWVGNATAASAPFRVTKAGAVTATDIVATGTINATGGYIGTTTALVFESQGINTGVTGYIRGGQTAYNTGTGYFLGYSSSTYKFSIGDGGVSKYMIWDGSDLVINGASFDNIRITYTINADEIASTWWTSQLTPVLGINGTTNNANPWTLSSFSDLVLAGADYFKMSATGDIYAYTDFLTDTQTFASTKDLRVKWPWRMDGTPTANNNYAFGLGADQTNFTNKANNVAAARFIVENATLYAAVGSGAGVTASSSLGTLSADRIYTFQIVWTSGTNFKFYLDGALVSTISTTMPTTGNMNFVTSAVRSSGTVAYTCGPVIISREL